MAGEYIVASQPQLEVGEHYCAALASKKGYDPVASRVTKYVLRSEWRYVGVFTSKWSFLGPGDFTTNGNIFLRNGEYVDLDYEPGGGLCWAKVSGPPADEPAQELPVDEYISKSTHHVAPDADDAPQ